MSTQAITDTTHKIYIGNAQSLDSIPNESVDLIVTSPPYPMIELWDSLFTAQNPEIQQLLSKGHGKKAFFLMHKLLDPVWLEINRTLKIGGFACINIGDIRFSGYRCWDSYLEIKPIVPVVPPRPKRDGRTA